MSNTGENELDIRCSDAACNLLSRENFLANLIDDSTSERIDVVRTADMEYTFEATSIFVDLGSGDNNMTFDDTFGTMTVIGGDGDDRLQVGQLYNGFRDPKADDTVKLTNTTEGYLSNGNSFPLTLVGSFGNDLFEVLRNVNFLDLNGESGDDVFIVRSFLALVVNQDGSLGESDSEKLTIGGGGDDDEITVVGDPEIVDFIINSLVDIDGGTGNDALVVAGTTEGDSYVISDGKVFGGGLSLQFRNIESLVVDGREGNDVVTVEYTIADRLFACATRDECFPFAWSKRMCFLLVFIDFVSVCLSVVLLFSPNSRPQP